MQGNCPNNIRCLGKKGSGEQIWRKGLVGDVICVL